MRVLYPFRIVAILYSFFTILCVNSVYSQGGDPSQIPGLKLWLRSDSGLVLSNRQVIRWTDISGNGNDAIAATTQEAPQYVDTSGTLIGGKVVRFNGSNSSLVTQAPIGGDFCVFTVSKQNGNTTTYQHLVEPKGAQFTYFSNTFGWLGTVTDPVFKTNRFHFLTVSRIGSAGTVYLNSTQLGTGTAGGFTGNGWVIGRYTGGGEYLNGDIAEILIYNGTLNSSQRASVESYLRYKYSPPLKLGKDIVVKQGFCDTTLQADQRFVSYLWSTGDTTLKTKASKEGKYWLKVKDSFGYVSSDTIRVFYPFNYPANLVNKSTTICLGNNYVWNTNLNKKDYTFKWQDNSTDSLFKITKAGLFYVTITDTKGCSKRSDTIKVFVDSFAVKASLGPAVSICSGDKIRLISGGGPGLSYLWGDGSKDSTLVVNAAGTYALKVTNFNQCVMNGSVNVGIKGNAPIVKFTFTNSCLGNPIQFKDNSLLFNGDSVTKRTWSFGDTSYASSAFPSHQYKYAGYYKVTLSVQSNKGCIGYGLPQTATVFLNPKSDFSLTNACSGGLVQFTDLSTNGNDTLRKWLWRFGNQDSGKSDSSLIQNPSHTYLLEGNYQVKIIVTSSKGCIDSIKKNVYIYKKGNPGSVALNSPKNNSVLNAPNVALNWMPLPCTLSYELQVAVDSGFSLMEINKSNLMNTRFNSLFPVGKLHFWRVRSFDGINYSPWSLTYSFFIASPSQIPGLKLWLRSDSGLVLSNRQVIRWTDISGNGNDAIAATTQEAPQYVDTSGTLIGGKVVRFNGSNSSLVTQAPIGGDFCVFTVSKQNGNTTTYQHLVEPKGAQFTYFSNTFGWLGTVTDPVFKTNRFHFLTVSRIGSAGTVYLNSTQLGTGTAGGFTGNGWVIGRYTGGGEYLNGDIAEILIYNGTLNSSQRASVESYLRYKYSPPLKLGKDIVVKQGFCDTTLQADQRFVSYLWSTGDTTLKTKASKEGKYWLKVKDSFGYVSSDTIRVFYPFNYPANLVNKSITICLGNNYVWNTNLNKKDYTFKWQDNSTDSLFKITKGGKYYVTVTDKNGCFKVSDSVSVYIDSFPTKVTLGPDVSLCTGNKIGLKTGVNSILKYLWSDGSTDSTLLITAGGPYSVKVTNSNQCIANSKININIIGKAPYPAFSNTATCIGQSTSFTDGSITSGSPITAWIWNFGDGTAAAIPNPVHSYVSSNSYKVRLSIKTANGCTNTYYKFVAVNPKPQVSFKMPQASCSRTSIVFSDSSKVSSGTLLKWFWRYGDPSSGSADSSLLKNGVHKFESGGVYQVKLIVTSDSGCQNTLVKPDTIKASPDFSFSGTQTCEGDYITFTTMNGTTFPAPGINSYKWNFGDNSPVSISESPSHLYAGAGNFNVSLNVTGTNKCAASVVQTISINAKPKVGFKNGVICTKTLANFNDTSSLSEGFIKSWKWDFGGKGNDSIKNPTFAFQDTGFYAVKLIATSDAGCSNGISKLVHVSLLPQALFSFDPSFGVAPLAVKFLNKSTGAIAYNWSFGDKSLNEIDINPKHTFLQNDTFKICLIAKNNVGCFSQFCNEIRVISPQLDLAVTDIGYNKTMSSLALSAKISNLGTRDVYYFEIAADIGTGTVIREIFKDTLKAGASLAYLFKSFFQINPNKNPAYFCVAVDKPNIEVDNAPSNNKQCKTFTEELQLVQLFPNPSENFIYFQYILPTSEALSIDLFDDKGTKIKELFSGIGQKGFNELYVDTRDIGKGVYIGKLQFRDQIINVKVVKL
jgi:PKD repeat protein